MTVRNFRCFEDETRLEVADFTTIIGANDVGKSSLVDALAIFLGEMKPDDKDACVTGDRSDMSIACSFVDLPESILIDATNKTSLEDEYLLNADGELEIHQVFNGNLKVPKPRTFIRAIHPSAENVNDLLSLKRPELKKRCQELGVDLDGVNQSVNAELRAAIRGSVKDLDVVSRDIEVDQYGAKEIFPQILEQLPSLFFFRSDRPSTDQDAEAQDPMKAAVRIALDQQQEALNEISEAVRIQVQELAERTLEKVRAMAPEVAEQLRPAFLKPKWDSVFKIGLDSDSEVPLNKRGSGVRRLVLLGFLQAQAESYLSESPDRGVIYAIEEPETSQHPDTQRALLDALRAVAQQQGYQVLITTHTPNLVRLLPTDGLRFVEATGASSRGIHPGENESTRELIRKRLGIHPDHDVRLFLGVEGIHDENFLLRISRIVADTDNAVTPLDELVADGRVIFIPVGGSSLVHWVSRLQGLRCREFYIFDRDTEPPDEPHYVDIADDINGRDNCQAVHTTKREMENYLHHEAINLSIPDISVRALSDYGDVPADVARAVQEASESDVEWDELDPRKASKKISNVKKRLNTEVVERMTVEMLRERDPDGELCGWLRTITEIAQGS